MSAARTQAGKRESAPAKKSTAKTGSPAVSQSRVVSGVVSVQSILGECIGASSLVEVAMHSLESQEIGNPEQEVLKRALKLIWSVHDWLHELNSDDLDNQDDDGEVES